MREGRTKNITDGHHRQKRGDTRIDTIEYATVLIQVFVAICTQRLYENALENLLYQINEIRIVCRLAYELF